MPLPRPRSGESQDDFFSRCMGNDVMNREYPEQEQRAAVCYSQWRRRPQGAEESFSTDVRVQVNDYAMRTEMHYGRKHIIVPVVMMVEGVHNGSHGPLFHPAEELGRFPAAWDGMPVVVGHPEEGGANISANDPHIIDEQAVGRVYNTSMEDGRLRAECWLDEQRLAQVSPLALSYISQGRQLEVSVGVFTEDDETPGTWGEEEYTGVARNHRPDHLALLPGEVGACSWSDGCGIRINEKGGDMVDEKVIKVMKQLSRDGYGVLINELGYREISQTIQTKLDTMDDDLKLHFLHEVFDDSFIYEVRPRDGATQGGSLYRRNYEVKADDSIEFTGEPTSVRRSVEYVTVHGKTLSTNTAKEVKEMKEKVNKLIADCRLGCFSEENRASLEALEEAVLDQMLDLQEAVNAKLDELTTQIEATKKENPPVTQEQIIKVFKEQFKDTESALQVFPAEIAQQLRHGMKTYDEQHAQLVNGIKEKTELYSEDELKAMSVDDLRRIAKLVNVPADYSGQGGGEVTTQEGEVEPMLDAGAEKERAARDAQNKKDKE